MVDARSDCGSGEVDYDLPAEIRPHDSGRRTFFLGAFPRLCPVFVAGALCETHEFNNFEVVDIHAGRYSQPSNRDRIV